MINRIIKNTFKALTIILLSQPLLAISSNDCSVAASEQSVTIDVSKFTAVWLKLNKSNNSTEPQAHLQAYLENALEGTKGTLDVEKFSKVWSKAGNNQNTTAQAHLQKTLVSMVENASKSEVYSHTK